MTANDLWWRYETTSRFCPLMAASAGVLTWYCYWALYAYLLFQGANVLEPYYQ